MTSSSGSAPINSDVPPLSHPLASGDAWKGVNSCRINGPKVGRITDVVETYPAFNAER